jgi:type VI secretion system protein ImpL
LKLITKFFSDIGVSKKPWFLIDGPRGSGKSLLLTGSAASFKSIRSGFFAGADAVYIDPPSAMISASDDGRGAFCRRLVRYKFLQRRALDGLLVVVDIRELLSMDAAAVDGVAADLRGRADAVASATGYDIPVYFIFNKIDLLDGFAEFFGDKGAAAGGLPVLGALLGGRVAEAERAPAAAFSDRFREICGGLSDVCVRKVISADNPGHYDKNRRLYGFLTRFTLAEAQIAAFLTEFFKPRGNEFARFCGFFFTSSKADAAALSRKVVGEVIPKTPYRAKEAARGTWLCYLRRAGSYALTGLLWAAFVSLFVGGGLRDAARIRALQAELSEMFEGGAVSANQFAALEKLRASREYLRGTFRRPWRLVFGTEAACGAVLHAYVSASERVAAQPAARFIESSLNQRIAARAGELPASERLALYRELEAYLLLTSGNPVKGVNADSAARRIASAFKTLPGVDGEIVTANIGMVVKLAAEGSYKNVPADAEMIETARNKLAAAPQAAAVYASVMDRLVQTHSPLPMPQITGGGGLLKYGRDVSGLYTRGGWENAALPELIKASKEPIKADWVTGPISAAFGEERLLSELVSLYADDLGRRWLDFIRNARVNVQPSLPLMARDLELLADRDGEVGRMLAAVCSLAAQQPSELSLSRVSAKSASSIKEQVSGAVNKLRGDAASIAFDIRDPFAATRVASFAHVEAFLKNGAFDGYQGGLGKLAAQIKVCGDRNSYVPFIARGADDPLRECRSAIGRACASMPAQVSAPLKRILEQPLDAASAALTKAVTEEIEESFRAEVVNPYVNKLINRYPFDKRGNDAAWSDFEEFFKPQSGILWRYRDKYLSGVMERTSRGWESAGRSAALPLSVNDELTLCFSGAERIADNFFKRDGAPKRHEIIFRPIKSSSGEAVLSVGDKVFDFKSGQPVTIGRQQGAEADEPITLRLTTADKAQEETRFTGEWSAIRLFEAGKVDRLGNDRYRVNWRLNVRGIYTANITATVQSNTEALFDRGVTENFVVPKRVFRNN